MEEVHHLGVGFGVSKPQPFLVCSFCILLAVQVVGPQLSLTPCLLPHFPAMMDSYSSGPRSQTNPFFYDVFSHDVLSQKQRRDWHALPLVTVPKSYCGSPSGFRGCFTSCAIS